MEYTNKLNLPESIARAVTNDPYTNGGADISVTGMIGPARKRRLEIDNQALLTTDVADRIWSLYGQIVHGILERADLGNDQVISERRLFIERHGWNLSGQFDRLILAGKTTLQDYKFTSVYAAKEVKPEYEAQGNIYKLMLEEHGYPVEKIEIICVLRDWSKVQARTRGEGYPSKPVVVLDVPVWSKEKTEAYITERLMVHGNAQTTLPACTPEETWQTDSVWKVKKKGNKTAVKGHAYHVSEVEADDAAYTLKAETGKPHVIEFHQGEAKRCVDYCEASPFCEQYQATVKGLGL
tara:strand:+ start:4130 stop:5014 length:885 start_codon:yes stop_codon:yes gene_type:complete